MIISLKSIRNVDTSKWSLTGSIKSIKNNNIVQFESSLERDYVYLLEYDDNIREYCEQPIIIEYLDKGFQRKYIPDFLVKNYNGDIILIEVKYQKDLLLNDNQIKFRAAKEFCLKNGLNFKVITEKEIRNDLLFNAKFLINYKRVKLQNEDFKLNILFSQLNKLKQTTPKKLIDSITNDSIEKAHYLYVLWYMIANEFVNYNKNCKLNMNSSIWTD